MGLKLFLISNMYPSKADGLFGVFVKNFKVELEKQGVLFSAISVIEGKSYSPLKKIFKYIFHYFSIVKNFIFGKHDIIYIHYLTHHLPVLLLLLPFKRKSWVINTHGNDIIDLEKSGVLKKLSHTLLKKTDLVVVPSSYFKEEVLKSFPFLKEEAIYISPSGGIDTEIFYRKENKNQTTEELHLGFISRFIEEKGWITFLDALVKLKQNNIPFKATMAGKGPDEKRIKDYLKKHILTEVSFLGFVNQAELVHLYNQFDLYIFPTYREAESLGLTGIEAMACGTPVIACNISGPKTYIKNNANGYLINPKDSAMLFEKIKKYVLLDVENKLQLSENAYLTSKEYDKTLVAKNLIKVLEGI